MDYRNPALAVDAAVRRGNEVLLIQRGNPPWKGSWALPGGFVDYGEDPVNAVLRELKEETNLDGKIIALLNVKGNPARDPRKHIVSIVYEIFAEGEPVGGDDAVDARFWPIEVVLNGGLEIAGDHIEILSEWLSEK
ncbi:MAG: NUDIX hydrolase [Candidatus Thalassarchaeaceae archaeon]|nr:NUDIX hydrolase [Candidatus Thalassarchaeaceae archaeon]